MDTYSEIDTELVSNHKRPSKRKKLLKILITYNNSNIVGTILMSLAGCFIGDYSSDEAFKRVDSIAYFIGYILTNPYFWFLLGIIFLVIGVRGSREEMELLKSKNSSLKERCKDKETIKISLDRSQEESRLLQSELVNLHKNLVCGWLKGLYQQVNLNNTARVTIYYEQDGAFYLLGRYSKNPRFAQANKNKFKIDLGVISKAWEYDKWVESDAPVYSKENPSDYNDYMIKKYEYTKDTLAKIRMKSCRFLGLSITDADENIGVILFESVKEDFLAQRMQNCIEKWCDSNQSSLCKLIKGGQKYCIDAYTSKSIGGNLTDANILSMLTGKQVGGLSE